MKDLKILNLPPQWESDINNLISNNRMDWEAWIESSPTYEKLREQLHQRGYINYPRNARSILRAEKYFKEEEQIKENPAQTKNISTVKKMLRKN